MGIYYDNIIIGAGPAGLQMAYLFQKSGRSYKVLEAGSAAGHFFSKQPRHRFLISMNKKYNLFAEEDFNLRHDWNSLLCDNKGLRLPNYTDELFPSADTLVQYLRDFSEYYKLNIKYSAAVTKVSREKDECTNGDSHFTFVLSDSTGETFRCRRLLMATGAVKENLPEIPGIELCTTYSTHDLDLAKYTNTAVCVVGGGNSAFEVANHLAGRAGVIHLYPRGPVDMAWDTHFPGDLRAINNTIIDMVHLKALHGVRTAEITKVEILNGKLKIAFDMELPHWDPPCTGHFDGLYDHVIFCTGWKYIDTGIFDEDCLPELTPCTRYAVLNEKWESSVENLYFIGTSMQQRDRRAASAFIHGFRYGVKSLFSVLEYENQEVPLPMTDICNVENFVAFLIERLSTTSALYQMNYGVLCDVVQFLPMDEAGGKTVRYMYELPREWVLKQDFCNGPDLWIIIMKDAKQKFGSDKKAEYFFTPPDVRQSDLSCSAFIQPIVQRYKGGILVEEYAVQSNLMVRVDVGVFHGDNGRRRIENRLKNLINRQFGIDDRIYDESIFTEQKLAKAITPWNAEKIKQHERQQIDNKMTQQCTLSFREMK